MRALAALSSITDDSLAISILSGKMKYYFLSSTQTRSPGHFATAALLKLSREGRGAPRIKGLLARPG